LYTQSPGDRGLCAACRRLLAGDVPWKADTAGAGGRDPGDAAPGRSDKVSRLRPRRSGLAGRRVAIGAAIALLAGGVGATAAFRRHALSDAWTAIERHIPSNAWSTLRRRTSQAWVTARHQASGAWASVCRRVPFLASKGDSGSAQSTAIRDTTVARGSQRRKAASSSKRSRDD
jgi:hypothetical protein